MQINVLGTMMDQVLYKSPYDKVGNETFYSMEWHPDVRKNVYAKGRYLQYCTSLSVMFDILE